MGTAVGREHARSQHMMVETGESDPSARRGKPGRALGAIVVEGGAHALADARSAIASDESVVFVSTAIAWEIAVKQGIGKCEAPIHGVTWLPWRDVLVVFTWQP